jgi:hypothetical protein
MSELEFPSNQDIVQIHLDTGDKIQDGLSNEILRSSGVSVWAEERHRGHGDFVEPRHLYVTNYSNPDESHHVAWVYHRGIINSGDDIQPYAVHHITCDCMADTYEDERIEKLFNCKDVHEVLKKRASDVSEDLGVTKIMEPLKIQEDDGAVKIKPLGAEIIKHTIMHLIVSDLSHPEKWAANMRSGRLLVDTVSKIVNEAPETVLFLLDKMSAKGLVEFNRAIITPGLEAFED